MLLGHTANILLCFKHSACQYLVLIGKPSISDREMREKEYTHKGMYRDSFHAQLTRHTHRLAHTHIAGRWTTFDVELVLQQQVGVIFTI